MLSSCFIWNLKHHYVDAWMRVCAHDWVDDAQRLLHEFWTHDKTSKPRAVVLGKSGISVGAGLGPVNNYLHDFKKNHFEI